jgi:hypothetical protein
MVLGHAFAHPRQIVHLVDEENPKGHSSVHTHTPDFEGKLWKKDVNLNNLAPHMRDTVYNMLG